MENIKIPVWLISICAFVFIGIVLEHLYISKRPVDLWGLKLNQPAMMNQGNHFTTAPIGAIIGFPGKRGTIPQGWMLCDGRTLSTNEYPKLYEVIMELWGGDLEGVFNLPDLRGRFIRGVDYGVGRDQESMNREPSSLNGQGGDEVGSIQEYSTALPNSVFTTESKGNHSHTYSEFDPQKNDWKGGGKPSGGFVGDSIQKDVGENGGHFHVIEGGDLETRPTNVYLNWIIRVN